MEMYKKLFWAVLQGFVLLPTIATRDSHVTNRKLVDVPQFERPIGNHTFHIGREAVLGCSVINLGKHKVGWLRAEDQTVLSLHERVVLGPRYSVSLDTPSTWQLRIRPLKAEDRGCYMCQINTQPSMKWQIGCIDVYVPPDIINEETSADVSAHEMDNITLICKATGHPPPKITWKREDHELMLLKKVGARDFYKVESYVGSSLPLWRVDRRQMGAFLCIASNDVPPAVSKRITLNVNFPPTVIVPNQLLGAPLGTDVVLECTVEAYPNTINYWLKNRGEMLLDGPKYIIYEERSSYKVVMKLTICQFVKSDIGTYNCVSTNSLGKGEGTLRLYEIKLYPSLQSAAEVNVGGLTEGAVKQKTAHSDSNKNNARTITVLFIINVIFVLN
ncbi:protein CEPU-1-like [Galleria mellonella]|uniref:Protein CEPU-1-like n=1 Tax=Galleria mellonella TaxID=7137 RepID=A0ABM3N4R8_GALME|nr:protein CEPU-1-like [Galleria mellonella]XP_052758453.1 protein CEPU-1-like [Galleria mellonella]XP_052758454.1 protein CEPU-1-like [Galleria mellonella]